MGPVPGAIKQFAKARYLNLETFRKSGIGVRTPVWFAQAAQGAILYVASEADAGKVKRIRNSAAVRIAPCSLRGKVRGSWAQARARICGADEAREGQLLLRRKYGWQKIIGDWFSRMLGHKQTLIAIELL